MLPCSLVLWLLLFLYIAGCLTIYSVIWLASSASCAFGCSGHIGIPERRRPSERGTSVLGWLSIHIAGPVYKHMCVYLFYTLVLLSSCVLDIFAHTTACLYSEAGCAHSASTFQCLSPQDLTLCVSLGDVWARRGHAHHTFISLRILHSPITERSYRYRVAAHIVMRFVNIF